MDGEPDEPVSEGVRELITVPGERPVLDRLGAAHPGVHWDVGHGQVVTAVVVPAPTSGRGG
ncbi:hypothetical protein ACF073_23730 [Streptomyces sp. NPDC015171]|uniref:hypothetical protein n=1 Tax=Streptomyces sp. NPDC015171 TaxID=3364945 RepID=UPI0036FA7753